MDEKTPKGAQAPIPAETTFEDELRAAYEELEAARRKLEEIKAKHPASFDVSESPEGANDAAVGTEGDASAPSVGPAQPDGALPREEAEAASGTTSGEGFRPYEPGANAFAAQGAASAQQNESWQQACAAAQVESASNAGQGAQQRPYGAQSSWQQQAPTGQASEAGQSGSYQQQAGQRPDGAQQAWQMPGQQAWCGGSRERLRTRHGSSRSLAMGSRRGRHPAAGVAPLPAAVLQFAGRADERSCGGRLAWYIPGIFRHPQVLSRLLLHGFHLLAVTIVALC